MTFANTHLSFSTATEWPRTARATHPTRLPSSRILAMALLLTLPTGLTYAAADNAATAATVSTTSATNTFAVNTPVTNTSTANTSAVNTSAVNTSAANTSATVSLAAEGQQRNAAFAEQARALRGAAAQRLRERDAIPPFTMLNDKGQTINVPETWAGKYIVLNFIFTRCQIPSMCPAATAQMTALQRELQKQGLADQVQLASVTFDPAFDTPEVLHDYARLFGTDASNFDFLTGPQDITDALLQRFTIITHERDGTINHTMTTTLISPDGVFMSQRSGPRWSADDFIRQIKDNIEARRLAAQRQTRSL